MRRLFLQKPPKVDERSLKPGGKSMTFTILLLDTETNGLPKNRFAPPSEYDAYPAILQLSWTVYEDIGDQLVERVSRDIGIALDPAIRWDTGAAKIHGLSEAEARHGTPAADALLELAAALRIVNVVVAHNLAFDKPVIRAAGYRAAAGLHDPLAVAALRALWPTQLPEFCTMKGTEPPSLSKCRSGLTHSPFGRTKVSVGSGRSWKS